MLQLFQKKPYTRKIVIAKISFARQTIKTNLFKMVSASLSLHFQQGGATISNLLCYGTSEEMLGDVVGREVRKISDSSSISEVKTKDGISCPLNMPLNILMEGGMLDMVVYPVSDSKKVDSILSAFHRLMSSAKREGLLLDKK